MISKALRSKGIEVRPESYGWSLIQTLIARSDRRIAPVIANLKGKDNSLGNWKKSYKEVRERNNTSEFGYPIDLPKPPPWEEVIHDEWLTTRILPWEHLNGPLNKKTLIQHYKQSFQSQ